MFSGQDQQPLVKVTGKAALEEKTSVMAAIKAARQAPNVPKDKAMNVTSQQHTKRRGKTER